MAEKLFVFKSSVSGQDGKVYSVSEGFFPSEVLDFRFGAFELPDGSKVFQNLVVRLKHKQVELMTNPKLNAKGKQVGVINSKEERFVSHYISDDEDIKRFFEELSNTSVETEVENILTRNKLAEKSEAPSLDFEQLTSGHETSSQD